jgi:hypothetical protein
MRKQMPVHWFRGDQEERFLYYTSVYLPVALIAFAVGGFFVSFAYLDPIYILAAFVAGLQASIAVKLRGGPLPPVAASIPQRGRPPQSRPVAPLFAPNMRRGS